MLRQQQGQDSAVIDYDEIESLLDYLSDHPHQLHAMIAGVADPLLKRAGAGGQWGAVEVFCHLRDLEDLFIARVELVLREDNPQLVEVDESLWPIERDYAGQNPHHALDQFCKRREHFVRLLAPLDAAQWHRFGTHQARGRQSVLWYAQHAVEHDVMHIEQLREILAWQQGEPSPSSATSTSAPASKGAHPH